MVKVDFHALLARAATTGFVIQGQVYTNAFVKGGMFSLDGIHPTDLSHGIIANALIEAVNAKFGARVPLVNLADYATLTSSRARPSEVRLSIPQVTGTPDPFAALRTVGSLRTP